MWIFPWIKSPDSLALCEANLDDLIDFSNFSVSGYLTLIQKDSVTYMQILAVYVKEGLPFARDLPLENSADSYLCFRLALLHSLSYCFFLFWSPSSSLCTFFDSISSISFYFIEEVFSINPFVNIFVFGDFNVHHNNWLTYYLGTGRPSELCYNFSISIYLTQMDNLRGILRGFLTVTLTIKLFWIYFFLLTLVLVLQWLSLHWKVLIMLLSQFPLTFHQTQNGMPWFIAYFMTILVVTGTVFVIIWEMFHERISLNSVLLLLLVNFVSGFWLKLM